MERPSSLKAVFDVLTETSTAERCGGDFGREVLNRADPKDIERVKRELRSGRPLRETASRLRIWPR